jgi:hypothetical protein
MIPEIPCEPSTPSVGVDLPETPGSAPGGSGRGEESAQKPERGECVECGRSIRLKVDGTVRHHGGPLGTGYGPTSRAYRCEGTGRVPRQVSA